MSIRSHVMEEREHIALWYGGVERLLRGAVHSQATAVGSQAACQWSVIFAHCPLLTLYIASTKHQGVTLLRRRLRASHLPGLQIGHGDRQYHTNT
jgi:hypothetical protein